MSETHEDFEPDDPWDCYQCGGEGFVWDCFDGFCVNAEDGCDDCTRACPECARRKRENAQAASGSPQVASSLSTETGEKANG